MYIIGITGGTGAGKSSAVKALQTLGAEAIDCDVLYHDMLTTNSDMISEIATAFNDVLINGEVDRCKLSEVVWSDPASLQKLNDITHKYVSEEIKQRIVSFKAEDVKTVAIDAIALIESGQDKKCDVVIGIIAPLAMRVSRIIQRDNLSRERALNRVNAQQPESFYKKRCDYILENVYSTEVEFEEKCIEFFKELIKRGGTA